MSEKAKKVLELEMTARCIGGIDTDARWIFESASGENPWGALEVELDGRSEAGRQLDDERVYRVTVERVQYSPELIVELDGVRVEYYGQVVPLNQVAALEVVAPRVLKITPWEVPMVGVIRAALEARGEETWGVSEHGSYVRVVFSGRVFSSS
jgi:hypothetical protein